MSELPRLGDEGDAFERELLASARADRMSAEAKRELVNAVAPMAAAADVPGRELGPPSAASRPAPSTGGLAKWVAWGAIGAASAAAVALVVARASRESRSTRAAAEPHAVGVVASAPAPEVPARAPPWPPAVPDPPRVAPAEREPVRPPVRPRVASSAPCAGCAASSASDTVAGSAISAPKADDSPASSLSAELRLIERARASLAAGRPGDALRAVDEHRSRFPRGVLAEEAAVLRVEAYRATGDRAAASALAREFLATHPRDAYTPRVQRALDALSGDGPK